MLLKQVGLTNGDKHLQNKIPNLNVGEYRYYPQDNPNLLRNHKKWNLSRKAFVKLLKRNFPQYTIDYEDIDLEDKYDMGGCIYETKKASDGLYLYPVVINKGYICFKKATIDKDGTVLNLHGGKVLVFKEKYVKP